MNTTLKITKIGNSAGVILPRDVLAHLGVAVGEAVSVVTTPRGIELAAADGDFEAQMAVAREVMAIAAQAGAQRIGEIGVADDWLWVATAVAEAAHREQLAEHGGGEGTRDAGALDSAMARPVNSAPPTKTPTRVIWRRPMPSASRAIIRSSMATSARRRWSARLFLALNGWRLTATDAELVVAIVALAAGELSEADLTQWFRDHTTPAQ